MKIVQVSPYYLPFTGGSEHYCHELSKRLVGKGYDVHVLTSRLDRSLPETECVDGVHVHRLFCPYVIGNVNPLTFIMRGLRSVKADVVHSHSYIFLMSNQAALARRLFNGSPVLLHLHGGIDAPITTHNLVSRLLFTFKQRLYDPTLGRWTVEAADVVASVSRRDIELAKTLLSDRANYVQVPNGVDVDVFHKGDRVDERIRVAFIGRLEPWKGVDVFLKAMKELDSRFEDLEFVIVGEGSLYSEVVSLSSLFRNEVKVYGQVPHSMIPGILSGVDVLVCSSYTEGMPSVCLEAFASNVPVVGSSVGGIPELVVNGETGFLMEPGDASRCAELVSALVSDEDKRRRMGENCRRLVEGSYSWEIVVEKVEAVYGAMLSE